jgi:hypothetical protein
MVLVFKQFEQLLEVIQQLFQHFLQLEFIELLHKHLAIERF